jgi:hypothetical protein
VLDMSVRDRFIAYLEQEKKNKVGDRIAHSIFLGYIALATILFVGAIGLAIYQKNVAYFKGGVVPIGLVLAFTRLKVHNERHTELKTRLSRSIPLWATVVMANEAIFSPGKVEEKWASLVLVTFDKELAEDTPLMGALVQRLFYLKQNPCDQPEIQQAVDWLLTDRTIAREGQRYLLPPALLDGSAVYAVDLFIHRKYLKEGMLTPDTQRIPCLIEPDNGAIWHLPHEIVDLYL